jgi:hypothetical protein
MTPLRAGALLAALALAVGAESAWAAFGATVQTTGTSLSAYVVPAPTGIHCTGLSSPTSSSISWSAVAPPPGDSVVYAVTAPGGSTTTTAVTSYALPPVTLTPGQYAVRAQISSGWRSAPVTITVSLAALGLLYLCSTP